MRFIRVSAIITPPVTARTVPLKLVPAPLVAILVAAAATAITGLDIRRVSMPADFFGEIQWLTWDRATRILHEAPHKSPMIEDAKLLADAVNLDDVGVIGLTLQTLQLARQGDGILQVADGAEKREQYGYWEARLKDGFHFEPVRQMAKRRVEHAREVARLLLEELKEDHP